MHNTCPRLVSLHRIVKSAEPIDRLRVRNQRQKSDVAQKLVAMCLHSLSSALVESHPELKVESESYINLVRETFGNNCTFCRDPLMGDIHVEHLVAMNRVRGGLHIAGNVVLSCKRCNNAKRQDDQAKTQTVGVGGWDNFLSHDGSQCKIDCTTCTYWRTRIPNLLKLVQHLNQCKSLILDFRTRFKINEILNHTDSICNRLEALYRQWQIDADFATVAFTEYSLTEITHT